MNKTVTRFLSSGGSAAAVIRGAAASVIALVATSAAARTVSVASVGETAAQLAFAADDGKAYRLAVCYGDEDGGATTNAWDSFELLSTVGAAETSRTVALPTGWGSTVTHLRYFLLSRPYAADLEFIGTGNKKTPAGVFFDSGVVARDGTKMVAEMEWISTASGAHVFCGAATNASTGRFWLYARNSATQLLGYLASGATINGSSYPVATGVKYRITTTLDAGAQSVVCERSVDGAWTSHGSRSDSTAGPFSSTLPLYLFADNVNGTAEAFAAARVYSLKLWQKDGNGDYRLVRHLVPAKTADGAAALWDRISETWFHNAGSGALSHGAESAWWDGFMINVW